MRNLYAKLGTHGRADSLACARALGLLAPSARSANQPGLALVRVRVVSAAERRGVVASELALVPPDGPKGACSVTCCAGTEPAGLTELAERITRIR
jgi:hypothetical protein